MLNKGASIKKAVLPEEKNLLKGIAGDTGKSVLETAGKVPEFRQKFEAMEPIMSDEMIDKWHTAFRKNDSRIIKFREKLKSQDPNTLDIARKLADNAGIDNDVFDAVFKESGVEGMTKFYTTRLKENTLRSLYDKEIEMSRGLVDSDTMGKILNNTNDSITVKVEKMMGARRLAMDMVTEIGGLKVNKSIWGDMGASLDRLGSDILGKISEATYGYYDNGYNFVGDTLKKFYHLNKSRRYFDDANSGVTLGLAKKWKSWDVKKRYAARAYIENYNVMNEEVINSGGFSRLMEIDAKTVADVKAKYGVELNYDDMVTINKTINHYRSVQKTRIEFEQGDYSLKNFYGAYEDIPYDKIVYKERFGAYDGGANYFHAVPTKEYFQKIMMKNEEVAGYIKSIADNEYKRAGFFMEMRKKGVSGLRLFDENRLDPADEILHYGGSYSRYMVKKTGNNLLDQAEMTFHLPMEGKGLNREDLQPLKYVRDQWDLQMNSRIRKKKGTADEQMQEREMWTVENLANTYGELALPLMLNPVTGHKNIAFNLVQLPIVAGGYKGYMNTISETVKSTSLFAKEVLLNKFNLEETFKSMASKQKTLEKDLFEVYMKRNPMLFSMGASQDMLAEKGSALRKVTDTITWAFQASDKISRFAGFASAVKHGKKNYEIFVNDLRTGMKPAEALGNLAKRTHLREFNKAEIDDILDTINMADPEKSMNNFLYKYAESSTYAELFDYTRVGNAMVKDWATSKSPLLSKFIAFRTWPLYYNTLVKGAIDSYKHGDKKPLLTMIASGGAMYAAMDAVQGKSEEDSYMHEIAETGTSRAPFTSYLGLLSMPIEPVSGPMAPVMAVPLHVIMETFAKYSEIANESGDMSDSMEYIRSTSKRVTRSSIFYRMADTALKQLEEE